MVIIQLDSEQLSTLVQNAVRKAFSESPQDRGASPTDQLLTIQQAAAFLSLSVPTLYGLVSKQAIPVHKQGKRLYFIQAELMRWIKEGRKLTITEIESQAGAYLTRKKGGKNA
ncbi:helix-turn-helix domain-containing protein [uncultured Mucilaginibacter sp.]|uniref:helix-turn-helix domain-containing protein n=1 Tax=uncultured Mucilaginibacter sp. TaxID=797541 RepID=UPI0025DF31EC|nr:helix-turn-helix domain-containing protein [uncultured Mucilaginibacter sp.]